MNSPLTPLGLSVRVNDVVRGQRERSCPPISTGVGAYVLVIRLDTPVELRFAGLPRCSLLPGWYAYAGSARGPGGLAARLGRHLAKDKRLRWHVDALTSAATAIDSLALLGADECDLLSRLLLLPGASVPLPGFGASDCTSCPAHLVAFEGTPEIAELGTLASSIGRPRRKHA